MASICHRRYIFRQKIKYNNFAMNNFSKKWFMVSPELSNSQREKGNQEEVEAKVKRQQHR